MCLTQGKYAVECEACSQYTNHLTKLRKLKIMSIETLLTALIAALEANTAAHGGEVTTKTTEKSASGKTTEKAAPGKTTGKTAEKAAPGKTTGKKAKDADDLDYEADVKPILQKVSAELGRPELLKIFAKFEVTKGDQIEEENYAEVVELAQKMLDDAEEV